MDIAITQDSNGQFDIALGDYDLTSDQGLRTAVLISLFTDRRADDDDQLPDGSNDRRGYWGDSYPDIDGDELGSRLWLLSREKQTTDVLIRAREYCQEALQWLIEDGIASTVEVDNEWLRQGVMAIYITITRGDGRLYQDVFDYELKAG